MKNILAVLEFEERSKIILEKAEYFAQQFNSKLWIVHIAAPDPDFVGFEVGPQHVRDIRAKQLKSEHQQLQAFASQSKNKGINAEALLVQGATSETILEEANKLQADLIVIGSHSHGLFYEAFVGSTTNEVINHADIPILVIPFGNKQG